jgi:hypothetical protein
MSEAMDIEGEPPAPPEPTRLTSFLLFRALNLIPTEISSFALVPTSTTPSKNS